MLREIQRELADIRDDRIIMMAVLNRLDSNHASFTQELRALRSQFDRFRIEVRENNNETREVLARIEKLVTK